MRLRGHGATYHHSRVTEEPLWKPWVWLATQFDYRACWSFPVETSSGEIVGTFAMYFKKPREPTEKRTRFRRHHNPRRRRRDVTTTFLSNDGCVQCPLLALSGHLPQRVPMSAFEGKADMSSRQLLTQTVANQSRNKFRCFGL